MVTVDCFHSLPESEAHSDVDSQSRKRAVMLGTGATGGGLGKSVLDDSVEICGTGLESATDTGVANMFWSALSRRLVVLRD